MLGNAPHKCFVVKIRSFLRIGAAYSFILGLGKAFLPRQDLISVRYLEVCEVEPLFTANILDEVALAADRLLAVSEFLELRFGARRGVAGGAAMA